MVEDQQLNSVNEDLFFIRLSIGWLSRVRLDFRDNARERVGEDDVAPFDVSKGSDQWAQR